MSSKRKSPPTKLEGGVTATGQTNILLTPPQDECDVKNLSPCPDETKDKATSSSSASMYYENVEKDCNQQQSPSNNSENYSETDLSSYHSTSSPYSDGENTKQQPILNVIKSENICEIKNNDDRSDDCEGPCKKQRMTSCDDSNNAILNSSFTDYKVLLYFFLIIQ